MTYKAEFLDGVLAERPVETWEGFAEKGLAVLLDDPEVAGHYQTVLGHGRRAMHVILEEDKDRELD